MGAKKKKIKAAGKFGAGYGKNVRDRFNAIESLQRKKQPSLINPKGRAKRIAPGIWKDVKTGRLFAGHAYHLIVKK